MTQNLHIKRGMIETENGESIFTPMPEGEIHSEWVNGSHLRNLIDYLKGEGWIELKTGVGGTGYLDEFDEDEQNGFGYDEHGRAYIQVNVVVDGEPGVVRIFERYTDANTILVGTGDTIGASTLFASSIKTTEFLPFVNMLTQGGSYIQPEEYFERSKVTLPQ